MNDTIVKSAISSFNNDALLNPAFFWTAVCSALLFIGVWIFAPDILKRFFPTRKNRPVAFAGIVEIAMIIWLTLGHGNWMVLRDGPGILPFISAAALFLLFASLTPKISILNIRAPDCWTRFSKTEQNWFKIALLLIGVFLISITAPVGLGFGALNICAVLFGIVTGLCLRKFSPSPILPILLIVVAMAMQPEYFRFGQLGHLSVLHLICLAETINLMALLFVFKHVRPRGIIADNHYKYIKWFLWLTDILCFILFAMTESVPVLLAFWVMVSVTAAVAVLHLPREADVSYLSGNLWALALMMTGIITGIFIISACGILVWNNNSNKKFWSELKRVML